MIRVRIIRSWQWQVSFGQACAVGLACLAAVAGEAKPVREKIQFSGAGDASSVPSSRPKADLPSKSFEFLDHGNSISGVVAPVLGPSAVPSYQRNPRLLDLLEQKLDQKRNWIYGQSADFGRAPTAEEVFNVGALGDAEGKPKTALESFLARRGTKPGGRPAERVGSDGDKRSLDKPSSRFDQEDQSRDEVSAPLTNPYESTRMLSAGFSIPNDFLGKSAAPARLNDFMNTPPPDSVAKMRDDRKHAEEFNKLLNFSGPGSPLSTGLSPIHLGLDTTRPELNPVTAPRLGELPGIGGDSLNTLRSINGPPVNRINELNDQATKILGPSSLAPAVSTQIDRPNRQPAPIIQEFPKRSF